MNITAEQDQALKSYLDINYQLLILRGRAPTPPGYVADATKARTFRSEKRRLYKLLPDFWQDYFRGDV